MGVYVLTNYEALHGWGEIHNHIRMRPGSASFAAKAAEEKLYDAYSNRTDRATTVDLTDAERAVLCKVISAVLGHQDRFDKHTQATPHLWSLLDLLDQPAQQRVEVVPDYRTEAATVQGLDALDQRLAAENIGHSVDDTGGATMVVTVPLAGTARLEIERGDQWRGDVHDTDDWVIIWYATGELGCDFEDLGFHLTMDQAVEIIRQQLNRA